MSSNTRRELLIRLALEYQEQNGSHIETIHDPTPIEFLRIVRIGRPAIIKGFRPAALDRWTDGYLLEKMKDSPLSVAVTPNGHADAIITDDSGRKYFAEPHIEQLTMKELLHHLDSEQYCNSESGDVYYLQSQNGNLYTSQGGEAPSELDALLEDVPKEVPWASKALVDASPDAVNIWLGGRRSITSVHSDPYENIYTVIRGEKHFTLFPPTEGWCLQEKMYPHAQYTRQDTQSRLALSPSSAPMVRWSSVLDPLNPKSLPLEAQPLHVDLLPGDTLYLPVGWWHHVRQSGTTIALNWWYDMEPRGMGWVWLNFLRGESEEVPDGNDDNS